MHFAGVFDRKGSNMDSIRIAFSDVDGTLLNSHHQITPDTLHQLNRLLHHTADHDHDGIAAVPARF